MEQCELEPGVESEEILKTDAAWQRDPKEFDSKGARAFRPTRFEDDEEITLFDWLLTKLKVLIILPLIL